VCGKLSGKSLATVEDIKKAYKLLNVFDRLPVMYSKDTRIIRVKLPFEFGFFPLRVIRLICKANKHFLICSIFYDIADSLLVNFSSIALAFINLRGSAAN
jgi:hypothetical protein